jgi:valyl-tRNA synthetase
VDDVALSKATALASTTAARIVTQRTTIRIAMDSTRKQHEMDRLKKRMHKWQEQLLRLNTQMNSSHYNPPTETKERHQQQMNEFQTEIKKIMEEIENNLQ